jgi:hypothetical protein
MNCETEECRPTITVDENTFQKLVTDGCCISPTSGISLKLFDHVLLTCSTSEVLIWAKVVHIAGTHDGNDQYSYESLAPESVKACVDESHETGLL